MTSNAIQKNYLALKEINALIISGNYTGMLSREIIKKHKASVALITHACRAGIFTRLGVGRYTSNVFKIDPIHARKVIEERNRNQNEISKRHRKKNQKYKPVPALNKTKPAPSLNKAADPVTVKAQSNFKPYKPKQQKTFSILWGLIKLSY